MEFVVYEGCVWQTPVPDSRSVAARHTPMVVYTSTGNPRGVLQNTSNRPACQTITDRGIAMIPPAPRPPRRRTQFQDWPTPPHPPPQRHRGSREMGGLRCVPVSPWQAPQMPPPPPPPASRSALIWRRRTPALLCGR